jgi:hypothetical protein
LRCGEADVAYAQLHPRRPSSTRRSRERKLAYRGEERTMRFRNIFSRDAECPEGRYIVIEHQTPELLWQEDLMRHENGAVALAEVIVVGEDARLAARLVALDAVPRLMASADFAARFDWRRRCRALRVAIAFADLDRALRLLADRGIVARRNGTDLGSRPRSPTIRHEARPTCLSSHSITSASPS